MLRQMTADATGGRQAMQAAALPQLDDARRPSVADQVFDALQRHILSLDLPPGSKMSEVEVAQRMGVSRQPVRDAFYRLSKLGFLTIRPQRATTVSLISEAAVMRAKFIRTALESETFTIACDTLTAADLDALHDLIAGQRDAVARDDRAGFHALDDRFHREICDRAGVGFAWDLIHESKAHMDRVRMLSLSTASQRLALGEHVEILDAIAARDALAATAVLRQHLSRIRGLIDQIKAENHGWFTEGGA
ncbi:transcriptional regulator, GntR family [Loktanella fryxellensis]|uniref:Transcriptional regulator, GntR family n=1 Tax=Loktanella fryxellensis TaxID=245187 RepID=A0A1H8GM37_9RHOB|nr:GntR family transcriptional regulator [Loktanella fryxellensis]SEN45033.1 transcriptional regulator, GntR family [Loktanella fryxellensis]